MTKLRQFINFLYLPHDETVNSNLLYLLLANQCRASNIDSNGNIVGTKNNKIDYHTAKMQRELIKYFKSKPDFIKQAIESERFESYKDDLKLLLKTDYSY